MHPQRFSLVGKTALVLGGSSGMVGTSRLAFIKPAPMSQSLASKVAEVLALLNAKPPQDRARHYGHVCDLRNASELSELVGRVLMQSGGVDILVNSQGIGARSR